MIIKRNCFSAGIVLVAAMLSSASAFAGCKQSDLTGTWITYAMSVDSSGQAYAPQTNRCKIKFDASGDVVKSKSSCFVRNWKGESYINVTGGNFKVGTNCGLKGSFVIGVVDEIVIDYGSLSKDRQTLSLIGYNKDYPDFITHLNGLKK